MASFAGTSLRGLLQQRPGLCLGTGVSISSCALCRSNCEADSSARTRQRQRQRHHQQQRPVNLQKRMTPMGYFSVLSETAANPSIPVALMELSGKRPFSKNDFVALWKERGLSERHDRFHMRLSPQRPGYFEPEPTTTTPGDSRYGNIKNSSNSSNSNNNNKPNCDGNAIEQHVTETVFPVKDEYKKDVATMLAALQTTPWDLTQSLWHAYVATSGTVGSSLTGKDEYQDEYDDDKSIVVIKSHHALADGSTAMAALAELADECDDIRDEILRQVKLHRRRNGRSKASTRSWWTRLWTGFQRGLWFCVGTLRALLYQGSLLLSTWRDTSPWHVLRDRNARAVADGETTTTTATTAAAHHAQRSVAWTTACSVDQVKWVAHILGQQKDKYNGYDRTGNRGSGSSSKSKFTINDVFLSCVTAALARQLKQHRQQQLALDAMTSLCDNDEDKSESCYRKPPIVLPRQSHMHIAVPVHLTGGVMVPGESTLSNLIGAFSVRLEGEAPDAATSGDPDSVPTVARTKDWTSVDRLRSVHKEMQAIKETPAPILGYVLAKGLATLAPYLPGTWTSWIYANAHAGATAVVTNARGPPQMHLANRTVDAVYGFVPLPPGIPIGITVISYAGMIQLSVSADNWAVPDPDLFLSWILEEYLSLVKAAKSKQKKEEKKQKLQKQQ